MRRRTDYVVMLPTWKIAELAGASPRTVQRAMRRGELDRSVESVFAWLLGKWSLDTLRSNREGYRYGGSSR